MTPLKINRAFALAGITMPTVRAHIERNMVAMREQLDSMTTRQLAAVIAIHNTAFHQGRSSNGGAEVIDGDAIWIGSGVDKLIPIEAFRQAQSL